MDSYEEEYGQLRRGISAATKRNMGNYDQEDGQLPTVWTATNRKFRQHAEIIKRLHKAHHDVNGARDLEEI